MDDEARSDILLTLHPDFEEPPALDSAPRRLLLALLVDVFAVRDCTWKRPEIFKQRALDLEWMMDSAEHPFSFVWVCQHLGLDPAKARCAYLSGCRFHKPKRSEVVAHNHMRLHPEKSRLIG